MPKLRKKSRKVDFPPKSRKLRVPNKMNQNRLTSGYIIIKMGKKSKRIKGENPKSIKRKSVTHKETPINLSAHFLTEATSQKEWHNAYKILIGKDLQPRALYLA